MSRFNTRLRRVLRGSGIMMNKASFPRGGGLVSRFFLARGERK